MGTNRVHTYIHTYHPGRLVFHDMPPATNGPSLPDSKQTHAPLLFAPPFFSPRTPSKGGHLDVLKYARKEGAPWDERVSRAAAANGHIAVLRYLAEEGCPFDANTAAGAAEGGRLRTLKFLRSQGCPWDEDTVRAAAMNRRESVLAWAKENGCPG